MTEARLMGGILAALGVLALFEARRLFALRTSTVAGAVVGDDTFPAIVGVAFLLLGTYSLFLVRFPPAQVTLPRGEVRRRMLWGAAALLAYCALVPYLGYTASTALGSASLFRTMGGYRWRTCLLLAAVTTAALYLLFRVWLLQPLPSGVLGV